MNSGGASRAGERGGSVFGYGISLAFLAILLFAAELRVASGVGSAARDLVAFAAALAAMMLVARAWGRTALARIEVEAERATPRAYAGERLELRVRLRNRKFLGAVASLEPAFPAPLAPVGAAAIRGAVLPPFGSAELSWTVEASRRGVYGLGAAVLSAGDPLGLYSKEKTVGLAGEVIVFPRIVPAAELEPPFRDYFGIHPSAGAVEDPAWYEGTREYAGRRPARSIHWKASARLGILQEKIYQPTSQLKVAFLLDGDGFLASGDEEGLERAIEALASAASRFAEKGASFSAAVNLEVRGYPASIAFGRGSEHLGSLLELLARCEPSAGRPLIPLPPDIASSSAGIVVVARSPDEGTKRYFALPARARDKILFLFAQGAELSGYPSASFGAAATAAPNASTTGASEGGAP
jgi:uncharacterized protein (DUF58 family)